MTAAGKNAPRRLSPDEIAAQQVEDPLVRDRKAAKDATAAQVPALQIDQIAAAADPNDGSNDSTATTAATANHHGPVPDLSFQVPEGNGGQQPRRAAQDTWLVTRHGQIPLAERRDFLDSVQTRVRGADVQRVKPIVIDLILEGNITSQTSLRRMLQLGCKFGIWCLNNTPDGHFVPTRDFTEDRLADFDRYAHVGVAKGTTATYMSVLRKLGGNRPNRRPKGRRVADPPYPNTIVRLMWETALELEVWNGIEMRTLLALSFGVGARSEEIHAMRASQIEVVGSRTIVNITRKHIVREVPAYGDYAFWLRTRAAQLHPDDYLFRPTVEDRPDSIGYLVRKSGPRHKVFENFKAHRARHTWVCNHLQQGLSYNVLRVAADVGPGSNLFSDLIPHLPHVSAAQLRRAFDSAHQTIKEPS